MLTQEGPPGTVVGVTVATSPGEQMSDWSNVIDPVTTNLSFVDVSHAGRSAAMSADGFGGQNGALIDVVEIETIDLHQLGSEIATKLRQASADPVVLCFDSLTDILQMESQETVHRFLNVLTARVKENGAYAHYHIDSDGHPSQTIETMAPIFDTTITVGSDP